MFYELETIQHYTYNRLKYFPFTMFNGVEIKWVEFQSVHVKLNRYLALTLWCVFSVKITNSTCPGEKRK